jgi:hypothetical protein
MSTRKSQPPRYGVWGEEGGSAPTGVATAGRRSHGSPAGANEGRGAKPACRRSVPLERMVGKKEYARSTADEAAQMSALARRR